MTPEMKDYLFDLNGYLILENAVDAVHVRELNAGLDALLPMGKDEWKGHVHKAGGKHIQQIYEAGEPFERLIDHPGWIEDVRHFVGSKDTLFDGFRGVFIDEAVADIRGPGDSTPLHSGGHERLTRTQYRIFNGEFHCGQINIILALTDIGPGDGATMVIPGSHKSNFQHPERGDGESKAKSLDAITGGVEVHVKAGDALLFVDALGLGSAKRINEGERRIVIYRYGPHWGTSRFGYTASDELLARLTPERRKILRPVEPRRRGYGRE